MMSDQAEPDALFPTGQGIPRAQWPRFFEYLSKEHRGEHATLELADREAGGRQVETGLGFRQITTDDERDQNRITIVLGNAFGEATTHIVAKATHVRFSDAEGSVSSALAISTAGGIMAVLRLSQPALPGK